MAETETLTITLPADLVKSIRTRVAAGTFASENEAILHDLREVESHAPFSEEPAEISDDEWEQELQRRIVQFQRGETHVQTLDQVKKDFAQLRRERISA